MPVPLDCLDLHGQLEKSVTEVGGTVFGDAEGGGAGMVAPNGDAT